MLTRKLGKAGPEATAIAVGTWAMGGQFWAGRQALGWGASDDDESIRALRHAFEAGATLFDTSDAYGTGNAERLIARALSDRRDEVIIATKWGNTYDEDSHQLTGVDTSVAYLRQALIRSLGRLKTDYVDLYQLHVGDASAEDAEALQSACEALVDEGLIRGYGWSTDDPVRAEIFASGPNCWAVQHEMNIFNDAADMLDVCERHGVASLNRSPLAMGLLTGKYGALDIFPADDIRSHGPEWLTYYRDGHAVPELLDRLAAIRSILTTDGRSLAQGALCWLLAKSPMAIPIVGCRTVQQTSENIAAAEFGPLSSAAMAEIDGLLPT